MFKTFLENTKRFFEPILLNKKVSIQVLLQGITSTVLAVVIPLLFVPSIVNSIQSGNTDEALHTSLIAFFIFVVVFLLRVVFMYTWYWASAGLFEAGLHKKYLIDIIMMDSSFFDKKGTGYTLSKYVSGIKAMSMVSRTLLNNIVSIVLVLGISIFLAFDANKAIGMALCFFIVLSILFIILIFKIETKLIYPSIEMHNVLSGDVSRVIMSKSEILYSNKIEIETKRIINKIKEIFSIEKRAYSFSVRTSDFVWLFPYFSIILVFLLYTSGNLELSPSQFTLIILLATSVNNAVELTFHIFGTIFDNSRNVTAFYELVDQAKIKGYDEGAEYAHKNGKIDLDNISFAYGDNNKSVLQDFSLSVPGGTKIALVGRSGSGKTTIAKLITGYMRPTKGSVFIDDQNLKDVALKSYYKHVGYLTQEPMVFDGTIRENLLYGVGDRSVSDDEVNQALKRAECDFIFDTKDGLDTQIGEKGIRLSGGERQRLAIAKLLLKNPEIIVLDEPTSALDSFSEEAITRALDELFKNRTVVIIAHRLQTVKRADKILVLADGKILEEGTHKELVEKGGEYAKMLEMQSGF